MENVVRNIDIVFIYIIGVSLLLLFLITAAMVYFVIRYRRGKNPESSDIRGNWKVETVWTVIPLVIALSMFYLGWESFLGLRAVPPGAIEIEVQAMQFAWVFNYPNKKQSEGVMVVPQGKPIKLNITSEDVIHSFYLPSYRIKMDALKGMKTYAWFYADKIGNYTIMCAEHCGTGHADMTAMLRIVPEDVYESWVNKK